VDLLKNSSSTQYRIIEFIGEGSFGKVAKCQVNSTSELVAVKILKDTFVKDVEEEVSVWISPSFGASNRSFNCLGNSDIKMI
uniref:Protein kinase domain-containing protein n=1 Tax=Gouania willdenowi TaxID=441366 RepID=A0A8C5ED43_GOUWI